MRELMAQMQGQGGFPIPPYAPHGHYQQEDEVQSHRVASPDYDRGESPFEREVGVDISSNYASGRPSEVQMSPDNFPPPYEQDPRQRRAGSVFDRISLAEPKPSQQQAQQPRTRPQPPPPMPQQPERRYEAEDYDSDEQQRSCDLDDDDENLPFSRELRNAQVPSYYVMLKIP
ncbi:nuclear receptor coactivator 6-like, partial [Olea europaea var. sylvestris]|uniref:nuclear receptor coactivator 6-like n=1 Tax=Olea europaea var. sylvestris TaxID=158386 RepID=UPI000C1D35A2